MCTADDLFIGDGECDAFHNNKEKCYDGGDCCGKDVNMSNCRPWQGSCDCIDPDFKPIINCPIDEYFYGDGFCDGNLNTKENCFDGGDCCLKEVNLNYCFPEEGDNCKCIENLPLKPWQTQWF